MKTVLLLILTAVSLATSACTTTAGTGYYLPLPPLPPLPIPQRIETANPNYSHNNYDSYAAPNSYENCESYYDVEPQCHGPAISHYVTNVPYHRGNIVNYSGVPIIAPSATSKLNVIIPNRSN
jgi:hypothetical protein